MHCQCGVCCCRCRWLVLDDARVTANMSRTNQSDIPFSVPSTSSTYIHVCEDHLRESEISFSNTTSVLRLATANGYNGRDKARVVSFVARSVNACWR